MSLLLMMVSSSAYAPDEFIEYTETDSSGTNVDYIKMQLPEFRIGVSPSAILNGFPAFQLSGDYRLTDVSELSLEMGYIFNTGLQGKGFRSRLSYEHFLHRGKHIGLFAGAALTTANVWEFVEYTVLYEEAYFREHVGFRRRNMLGGFLTAGIKFELGGGAIMELSSALGYTSFFTSTLDNQPVRDFGQLTLYPSVPGWTPFPGYYNNLNISMPVDITPIKNKWAGKSTSSKVKKKKSKKRRKKKRRRRRR